MKKFFTSFLLILIIGFLSSPATAQKKSLFNGKNLKGWEIYGTEKWFVEDGLLVCESGPDEEYGYLAKDIVQSPLCRLKYIHDKNNIRDTADH